LISGTTILIAHLGFPTASFKAPMIYNPYFEQAGIDAVLVPMGVRAEDFARFLPQLFKLTNIRGSLITMPHKITTMALLSHHHAGASAFGGEDQLLIIVGQIG